MTFLTPIPALIAAALAAPALVFLYMLKLRRRPVRVPSTMLWEHATADLQANVPLKWLRPSWLLLLHMLILAALLLAMARPTLDDAAGRSRRILIVLDRSASMQAADGEDGTRFEEAVRRAKALVQQVRRSGTAASIGVVGFAAEARLLTPLAADTEAALRALDDAVPTDQPGNLQAAFDLALALLMDPEEREDDADRPLIVLFSDGGIDDHAKLMLGTADLRLERVGPAPDEQGIDNLGIVAIAARREYEDPGTVRLFVRVQNASTTERATHIEVLLDGVRIERQPLIVPPARPGAGGTLTPGMRSTTVEFPSHEGGVLRVRIDRPDVLAADNHAAVVLEPARSLRLLVVRAAGPGSANRAAWIVDNILAEIGAREVVHVAPDGYARMDRGGEVAEFDLIIFDGVTPERVPPVPTLSFGAGLPVVGLELGTSLSERGTNALMWDRAHPLLRHVAIDTLYVSQTLAVIDEGATVLARGRDGPLMLLLEDVGVRRLVVAFDLARSNWPLHYGFAIFLAAACDYLALVGDAATGAAFSTSEPVRIRTGVDDGLVRFRLEGEPTWRTVPARRGSATLGVLERAGVYETPDALRPKLAVNLTNERESLAKTRDSIEVSGQEITARAGTAAGRLELWPWFVLGAGVLLLIEWLVYGARMRV
ncbi:MAG: VWA domain-containing protein [Phycisphaeraceae bacterium]|nr:VWA domain-containing protein [Phycisphaeraceae bacterium]